MSRVFIKTPRFSGEMIQFDGILHFEKVGILLSHVLLSMFWGDPFVKKVGKGAPSLQSPGKKNMFEGWSTQCDTSWEVQVVFFFLEGMVGWESFGPFFMGFSYPWDVSAVFSSFVLVETCFVALESCLSNAHPHVPPSAWRIEASSGDTRSTFGFGGGWSRFVDSSLIGWFFLCFAWLVCWFYFCLGGVFSFCLVC